VLGGEKLKVESLLLLVVEVQVVPSALKMVMVPPVTGPSTATPPTEPLLLLLELSLPPPPQAEIPMVNAAAKARTVVRLETVIPHCSMVGHSFKI
jgi:hypothetical protein